MKTFRFIAFQDMKGSYKGYLEIEAKNEKEAKLKLSQMQQSDLENDCFEWTQTDDSYADGNIDVDSESIHEID